MNVTICPCGSKLNYTACCQPYHQKVKVAPTAVALMRSRYAAFVLAAADYLVETTYPTKRSKQLKNNYLKSAKNTQWLKLEILYSGVDVVEFKAYYLSPQLGVACLHEKSTFKLENGVWFYVDGVFY